MPSLAQDKAALRRRMRDALAGLAPAQRALEEELVTAAIQATPEWAAARTVLLYRSVGTEWSTVGLANAAWRQGKTVAFPRMDPTGLQLHVVASWTQFVAGPHAIPEPSATARPVQPGDIDLAIVPGLAFDPAGGRLGRGGGDFDRLLPKVRRSWAPCFDLQVIPAVPMEAHDHSVQRVVHAANVS